MFNKHESERDTIIRRKKFIRYLWAASYFMGIGFYLAITVGVCVWLGIKADEAFGTAPKGTVAGIAMGFPVAIYSIYYQVRSHFSGDENEKDENKT